VWWHNPNALPHLLDPSVVPSDLTVSYRRCTTAVHNELCIFPPPPLSGASWSSKPNRADSSWVLKPHGVLVLDGRPPPAHHHQRHASTECAPFSRLHGPAQHYWASEQGHSWPGQFCKRVGQQRLFRPVGQGI
jgi:hypothetical protein